MEGNDTLKGFGGADWLYGGDGADVLYGLDGGDMLYGGNHDDILLGGNFNDFLFGGNGKDTLIGGADQDIMQGNAGADTFKFATVAECGLTQFSADKLVDFSEAQLDIIDLSGIDANSLVNGNQAFTPIGTNVAFNGVAGELRFNNGYVEGDVDGDMNADFHIQVNAPSLQASSFIF